jgi:serine/threonine protein kinase
MNADNDMTFKTWCCSCCPLSTPTRRRKSHKHNHDTTHRDTNCRDTINPNRYPQVVERAASAAAPGESVKALLQLTGHDKRIQNIPDVNTNVAYVRIVNMLVSEKCASRIAAIVMEGSHGNLLTVASHLPKEMLRLEWSITQFVVKESLHVGYASKVYSATCTLSNKHVVIKHYRLGSLTILERIHLYREMTIHAQLNHPNIVQFYAAFKENQNVYLVIEYIQGMTLRNYLKCSMMGKLTEAHTVNVIMRKLLHVLKYLHDKNIIHRDIKPDNVMLQLPDNIRHVDPRHMIGLNMDIKLIDFGLATDLAHYTANTRAGTLTYMAPEVLACKSKSFSRMRTLLMTPQTSQHSSYLQHHAPTHAHAHAHAHTHAHAHNHHANISNTNTSATISSNDRNNSGDVSTSQCSSSRGGETSYNVQADVWATGVMTYELLMGQSPFRGKNEQGVLIKICEYKIVFPKFVSDYAKDFILRAMAWNSEDRPSIDDLINHAWIATLSAPTQMIK